MIISSIVLLQSEVSNSVQIIKALGETWPLCITIFLIIAVITYRKNITIYLSRVTRISGKVPVGEFSIEVPSTSIVVASMEETKQSSEKIEQDENSIGDDSANSQTISLLEVNIAYLRKDFKKGNEVFEKLQDETKAPDEKNRNELSFLRIKYMHSGINTIPELEGKLEKLQQHELKLLAITCIADCYYNGNNIEMALSYYEKYLEICSFEDSEYTSVVDKISSINCEQKAYTNAEEFIKNEIEKNENPEVKAKLFGSLAKIFKKQEKHLEQTMALELALQYDTTNTDYLFDQAYAYGSNDLDLKHLSLLSYGQSLFFNSELSTAFNNIGVAFQSLKLNSHAFSFYKKAFEKGNTLAAANLAYLYIDAGLYEDATNILSKARTEKNVHENVWSALRTLSERQDADKEKANEIEKTGKEDSIFIRNFAKNYFSKTNNGEYIFAGLWDNNLTYKTIDHHPLKLIEITWQSNSYIFTFYWIPLRGSHQVQDASIRIGSSSYKATGWGKFVSSDEFEILVHNKDLNTSQIFNFKKS